MPVLLTGGYPDDIALLDFFDGVTPTLHPTCAPGYDQDLAQRMTVPRGARSRLKCDEGARGSCRRSRLLEELDTHGTGEVFDWALLSRQRAAASDFYHLLILSLGRCQRE